MKNREKFFLLVAVIGFIAFFLPWLGLDIGASGYSASPSLSGFDIVKLGDSFKKNFGESPHLITIFILLTFPVVFLISFLTRLRVFKIPVHILKLLEFLPLVASMFIFYKISSLIGGQVDTDILFKALGKVLNIGFYLTLISSILILIAPIYTNEDENKEHNKPDKKSVSENLKSEISKKESINIQETITSFLKHGVTFCKKYAKVLLIFITIIIAVFIGNIIMQDIQKQQRQEQMREQEKKQQAEIQNKTKTLATALCKCHIQAKANTEKEFTAFLETFEVKQYKKPSQAQKELSNLLENAEEDKNSCESDVQGEISSFSNSLDFAYESTFEELLEKEKNSCKESYTPTSSDTYRAIIQKIETIKLPEPTIDDIKNDLIGKKIPVWEFGYRSEFTNSKVDATKKYNDDTTLRYTVSTGLQSEKTHYETILFVYYKKNREDWIFEDVKMQLVSVIYTVPDSNDWMGIKFLNGYKFSYDNSKKLRWLYNLNVFKKGLDTGPDVKNSRSNFQKECWNVDKCHVQSREGKEVQVKFTYTLKE